MTGSGKADGGREHESTQTANGSSRREGESRLLVRRTLKESERILRIACFVVPLAVVIAASALGWIGVKHAEHASTKLAMALDSSARSALTAAAAIPGQGPRADRLRNDIVTRLSAHPAIACATLSRRTGPNETERLAGKPGCTGAGNIVLTSRKAGIYRLDVGYHPDAVIDAPQSMLRLIPVAMLCGLAIAILFNALSFEIVFRRDILNRARSEAAARRERRRAEKANKAKSAFLAKMSHEIRTPLNGIIGMAALLADNVKDPANSGYASMIHSAGQSLFDILNDVLDLAKIEAGKMQLEPDECVIRHVLDDCLNLFHPRASEAGIELSMHISPDTPKAVLADTTRLRQVINNLVSNAVKFSKGGEVRVTTSLGAMKDGIATIHFAVSDTGPGIPYEDQELIFESFAQSGSAIGVNDQGTGLGLSICREITGLMGGSISVVSKVGEGSTFTATVNVPVIEGAARQDAAAPAHTMSCGPVAKTTEESPQRSPVILLVCNDAGLSHQISKRFRKRGYRIRPAATFSQASQLMKESGRCTAVVNLDQESDAGRDVGSMLDRAAQLGIAVVGMSDRPASLPHEVTSKVHALVMTPGDWDEFMREVALATAAAGTGGQEAA